MGRKREKKQGNKKLILIIVIIFLALIAGIVFYVMNINKSDVQEVASQPIENTAPQEPAVEEKPEPEVEVPTSFANEYEEAVLKRDKKNNDYKIIEITEKKCHGYLTVIYDASRLGVVATSQMGKTGEYLVDISKNNNAVFAVNGGGFNDANFEGNGSYPLGITISNGNYLTKSNYGGSYGVIGLDKNNKLVLGKYSVAETESLGLRDAVTFGPILIQDGVVNTNTGTAAVGRAARTAIAQRADGLIMFLVLDGDRTKGQGAIYSEVAEILKRYGAVTAASLDGGTSSCMTVHSNLVNDPTSMNGQHRTRELASAFILKPDKEDNGDYTVVADKVK